MKRTSVLAVLVLAALFAGAPARGQQAAPTAAPAAVAVDTHEAAAREFVRLCDVQSLAVSAGAAMIDAQVQANPKMAPYADILHSWVSRVFQEIDLESIVAQLYKEAFSEAELRDLIVFYRTPTGKKALTRMPELMQKGAAIGMQKAQEHAGELQELIAKRSKELEEKEKSAADQPPAAVKPPSRRR